MGFIYPALDQIANHMARMRNRTRGRLTCPVVMRMPHGGGIHAPGASLREPGGDARASRRACELCAPPRPRAPTACCLPSIRDPDPVIFLEPARLYRLVKQEVADDGQALPLDVCYRLREGSRRHDRHLGRDGDRNTARRRAAGRAKA